MSRVKKRPPKIITNPTEELRETGRQRKQTFQELLEETTGKPTFPGPPMSFPPDPRFITPDPIGGGSPGLQTPTVPNILTGINAADIARLGENVSRVMAASSKGEPFDPDKIYTKTLIKKLEMEQKLNEELLTPDTLLNATLKRSSLDAFKSYYYGPPSNHTEVKNEEMRKLFPESVINKNYFIERPIEEANQGELQGQFGLFSSRS